MDVVSRLKVKLIQLRDSIDSIEDQKVFGTICRSSGFMIEALGLKAGIGSICGIFLTSRKDTVLAEVIGFSAEVTYLMAYEDITGLLPGNLIFLVQKCLQVPVGSQLLGRILNGLCQPIDDKGALNELTYASLQAPCLNPIQRRKIAKPLDLGIKAINALMTVGQGQRLGIFAGTGVGKSMLLGMMTAFTDADVVVIGLIGERGREVKEFIEENIAEDRREKTIVVASPIDTSPLVRANAAMSATTIAEHFRDLGLNVLLIVDSLTRYAQALRQIYLSLGEMPTAKGFSPTVFAKISQLVERGGMAVSGQGSITAFYTVLVEGDDLSEPLADHARSILDGHFILSRSLADSGHYPAIDIARSISRVMHSIVSPEHLSLAQRFKRLFSLYQANQDLIKMGLYQAGIDPDLDLAVKLHNKMLSFLVQGRYEKISWVETLVEMQNLLQ